MSLTRTLQYLKPAALLGSILGLSFGCIVTLEQLEPCDSGSNNKLTSNGECECRVGFEWCNPNDPEDLNCCSKTGGGETVGDGDGDPSTGDGDPSTGDGDPSTGDGDGDGDGDPGELPPEDCASDEEGFVWCTHDEAMGPQGSRFFMCTSGKWIEDTSFLDDDCQFNGYDFAYGCVDNGVEVVPVCGDGPGTPCNADDLFCADDDNIASCVYGKETWDSCMAFCVDVGIGGETFEHGECDSSIPDDIACYCCDGDDPECPV
jgi:hypothetical protein